MYPFLAVSLTLGCCLYASLTDLRERKIKNLCSFGLLYCGLILQVIFFLQGQIPFSYLLTVTLGGGALAYLSYLTHFFAPGDAKLFWAACVALPPTFFDSPNGYVFAPLVLGINTFVPYLVGLLLYALLKTGVHEKWRVIQTGFAPKTLSTNLFGLLGFMGFGTLLLWVVETTVSRFSIPLGPVVKFLLVLGGYQAIFFWARARRLEAVVPILGTSVCITAWLYMGFSVPVGVRQSLFTLIGLYVGVYAIFRPLILMLANPVIVTEVSIAELEAGMLPAEAIVKEENAGEVRYIKVDATQSSIQFDPAAALVYPSRPLDTDTVHRLKAQAQEGDFDDFGGRLRIQKTIPFAPFIALGVLLTVIFRGSIFSMFS